MGSKAKRKWCRLRTTSLEPSAAITLTQGRHLVVSCVMRGQSLEYCGRELPNILGVMELATLGQFTWTGAQSKRRLPT